MLVKWTIRWGLLPFILVMMHNPPVRAAQLGDRLVLAVNQVPYSQRQLELYFAVRAGLRKEPQVQNLLVSEQNWRESVALFADDMMILQEAQRLGSFGGSDQAVDKFSTQLQTRKRQDSALASVFKRLDCDDQTLARVLDNVLRVAAFRRSKNRQEAQGLAAGQPAPELAGPRVPKWFSDLQSRSSSRLYAGAEAYLTIMPALQRSGDGL